MYEEYCKAAVKALENIKYYYEDLKTGMVGYLLHQFPNAEIDELVDAVDHAISVVFFDGCELEIE